MCNGTQGMGAPRVESATHMAVGDAKNLAARMRRISELTETCLGLQTENDRARTVAEQVSQEIAIARLQIRLYTVPVPPHAVQVLPFVSSNR